MQLDRFDTTNNLELEELSNFNINIKHFEKITEIIRIAFQKLKINPEEMSIYYQRYQNSTSVLAIKLINEKESDIENYMFCGCTTEYYNNNIMTDIYMHSEAKASKKTLDMARLISKDITEFFQNLEKDLFKNNLANLELALKISLNKENKQYENGESKIKKLVKSIIK